MKCCINCFNDDVIRDIIKIYGTKGDCDFCSSKNICVYDISESTNMISDKILSLIQIYSPSDHPDARLLKEILRDEWDIFSGGAEGIKTLVAALCPLDSDLNIDKDVFTQKVSVEKLHDDEFINECGIVKGLSWSEFSESIKHTNRFFNSKFNVDVFSSFLTMVQKKYAEGTFFYRARIAPDKKDLIKMKCIHHQ